MGDRRNHPDKQLTFQSGNGVTGTLSDGRDSGSGRQEDPGVFHEPTLARVPWYRKVTTRFFLWLFLALSAGFLVLGYQIDRMEQNRAVSEVNHRLEGESGLVMVSLLHLLEKGDLPGTQGLFSAIHARNGDQAALVGPDGHHVLIASEPTLPAFFSRLQGQGTGRRFDLHREPSGRTVFSDRTPLFGEEVCKGCQGSRKLLGYLVLYTAGNDYQTILAKNRWTLFWMFSGLLETLVLVIILLIRRSLVRPLDGLAYAIARVGPENPDLKLSFPMVKNDELGRLVFFLNRFIDLFRGWMGEVSDRVKWVEAHADLLGRDHVKRYQKEEEIRQVLNELRLRVRDLLSGKPRSPGGEMAMNLVHFLEKSRKIQEVSESVHASVREARTVSTDLGIQGESITKMKHNLSQAFSGVLEISKEMHLTGINAAIEASHADIHGRTFRIVADTVATLSRKTEGAVNEIGTELSGITRQLEHMSRLLASGSEELETAESRLIRFQEGWRVFQDSLGKLELQWTSVADRIESETAAILKIQEILDALSEDFREQLVQKPLEERHLGEIMKVVKELNVELDRFRI